MLCALAVDIVRAASRAVAGFFSFLLRPTLMDDPVGRGAADLPAPSSEWRLFREFWSTREPSVNESFMGSVTRPLPFRAEVVAVSGPGLIDTTFIQSLATLHQRSATLERRLSADDRESKVLFDIIVLGAGIHEQIFQNTLRAEPKGSRLRVLTIERGSVISETTTFAGERVNSNSSVRSSVGGSMSAIPGVGNINNFPCGVLQLDDVKAQGLGPLGNFGKVATINRNTSANDVLFGWTVDSVQPQGKLFIVNCKKTDGTVKPISLSASVVVDARGIGEPRYPALDVGAQGKGKLLQGLAEEQLAEFRQNPDIGAYPTVIHSKYFYETTSLLDDPYAPFAGKRVTVIGGGDSGKTIMEFLARILPPSAYGSGTISRGSAKLTWVLGSIIEKDISASRAARGNRQQYVVKDPTKVTQEEYEAAVRSRYRPLGARFPKSTDQQDRASEDCQIDGLAGKLTGVSIGKDRTLTLEVSLNPQGRARKVSITADVVILATSLRPDYGLYKSYGFAANGEIERPERPEGRARNSSPYAVIPAKKVAGQEIYFIGPGGGEYLTAESKQHLGDKLGAPNASQTVASRGHWPALMSCAFPRLWRGTLSAAQPLSSPAHPQVVCSTSRRTSCPSSRSGQSPSAPRASSHKIWHPPLHRCHR